MRNALRASLLFYYHGDGGVVVAVHATRRHLLPHFCPAMEIGTPYKCEYEYYHPGKTLLEGDVT